MHRAKTVEGVTDGLVARLSKRICTHMTQSKARRSLGALDDHILRDLGLSRADIDYVIRRGRRQ